MSWRGALYENHCRLMGQAADPFNHPPSEDIDSTVPGYGAAADGQIDRLSYPPTPSGATPHERFGHPHSWYERLQFEQSGIKLGRMEEATLRSASAELCAQTFQKKRGEGSAPKARVMSKKNRRARGDGGAAEEGRSERSAKRGLARNQR